ncbi:MAG: hypothetical protein ACREMY_08315 [bacterium]
MLGNGGGNDRQGHQDARANGGATGRSFQTEAYMIIVSGTTSRHGPIHTGTLLQHLKVHSIGRSAGITWHGREIPKLPTKHR